MFFSKEARIKSPRTLAIVSVVFSIFVVLHAGSVYMVRFASDRMCVLPTLFMRHVFVCHPNTRVCSCIDSELDVRGRPTWREARHDIM
jgi:hypothetical protein